MNSLFVIAPYKYQGMWVFDDPRVGLVQEPFVGGADEIIDAMVADIPQADKGFRIVFSAGAFPGFQYKLKWVRAELSGNVYLSMELGMEGWLCPALLKYFPEAPREIYLKVEAKQSGTGPCDAPAVTMSGALVADKADRRRKLSFSLVFPPMADPVQ